MSEFFDEPASWYAEPDAPAIHFELLSQAIAHALSLPTDRRHPLAKIATEFGTIYGWDAIKDLRHLIE